MRPEAREALGLDGEDLIDYVISQLYESIVTDDDVTETERTQKLGRHGLMGVHLEGENIFEIKRQALALGMPEDVKVVDWLNEAIREGAKYYDTNYQSSHGEEPESSERQDEEDDTMLATVTDITPSPELFVVPDEFIDLNQHIRDLFMMKRIASPIITQGLLVLFEQEVPPARITDDAIQRTVQTVAAQLYEKIPKGSASSKERSHAFDVTTSLLLEASTIERKVTIVSDYARRIEAHFASFEQAKQYVETQVAIAIMQVYGKKSNDTPDEE